ncbi:MAG: GAF domain-containing sensor histidine kinase [Anaerolineales bacterium]|nr:GAF domain-containing sensor histidine kinase [Anaerolineales bacterium]
MNLPDINALLPLIAAGFYTILLIVSLVRQSHHARALRWLLLLLVISLAWEFVIFFAATIPYPNLPLRVVVLNTAVLAMTTAVYLDWRPRQRWYVLGIGALASIVVLDIVTPTLSIPDVPNLPISTLAYGTLLAYLTWFALSGLMLLKSWRSYQESHFPWHANRLLYWSLSLIFIFLGEIFLFTNLPSLAIAGQIIRYLGMVSLTYAIFTYRIFDVRTRAQRTLAFLIINTISALPFVVALIVPLRFREQLNSIIPFSIFLAVIVTLVIFFYQSFRTAVEKLTYRYIIGESVNTRQVVRNYSQAISRTLDVQQLSLLIIGTLSELLETNRGALMLFTRLEDGKYEINPIPGMGKISRTRIQVPEKSLFTQTLITQRQPMLQYDIDYNPEYAAFSDDIRQWLQETTMEAFVPICAGDEITALIGIGPKNSAVPYQPSELELVQILADQTVVALQNARLFSELGDQNEHIRDLNKDLVEQNERLEIMDRVKSDFITIASHELRTPLTQVKGYTDILAAMNEENALTREQTREIVGHVNRATLQLESLITAMLDASQLDVDGMQLTFVKTQLDTILKLALEPLIQAMRERRITLKMHGVDDLPPIQADFKRLVQAFTNIVGNAVKYTPDHGQISITASLIPGQTTDEFLEIVFSDSGIGIDPKFHDLIFEKFFRIGDPQLHSTGNTKFKGAGPGLGLPIAKGVIEAHGGRIWVESDNEDEEHLPGSQFHVILPVRPRHAELDDFFETESRSANYMN